MMDSLKKLISNADGDADVLMILSVVGVAVFVGLAIYAVAWKSQTFDASAYGTGLGLAIGGAATGIGLKSKLEKKDGDN